MRPLRESPLLQLTLVKLRELVREPEALFWVFVFPVLLALALGIAFRGTGPATIPVAVVQGPGAEALAAALSGAGGFAAELLDERLAAQRLAAGRVAVVVQAGAEWTLRYDPSRPDGRAARLAVDDALQRSAGRRDVHPVRTQELLEPGSRYIDFLVPGLLGMNLMGTGMWGIGFYLVNARAGRLLKRLVATPMRRSHFLLSQLTGRLIFLVFEVGVLVSFARVVFDVPLRGSVAALAAICVLGALTFGGLGLLVASRARTTEGVTGLMNLVMLPMWIGSGTFFSTARFPAAAQPLVQALPLTAINDALRAVMLEGSSLAAVSHEILIATAWAVAAFAAALYSFRWS
jgi:ABC-type multidrug transport system permease subunit